MAKNLLLLTQVLLAMVAGSNLLWLWSANGVICVCSTTYQWYYTAFKRKHSREKAIKPNKLNVFAKEWPLYRISRCNKRPISKPLRWSQYAMCPYKEDVLVQTSNPLYCIRAQLELIQGYTEYTFLLYSTLSH